VTASLRILMTHVYAWPETRRGAERYLHEVSAALLRKGHDVDVVVTAERPGRDRQLGVPVRRLKRRHPLSRRFGEQADQVAFAGQTLPLGLTGRYDVWHAMSTGDAAAAGVCSRLRPRLRSVYTEMGIPERSYRSARRDHSLYRLAVRTVDEFVCLSAPAADALARDYGRRGTVVPGGVDLDAFRPAARRAARPTLLFPGHLGEPRKNARLFLEAVAVLAGRGVDVDVWLAGPGELPPDRSAAADRGLERVTLHRQLDLDALRRAYAEAWVTVLPSQWEVFGLVVLESFASGTPVVVLDDGLGPALLVDEPVGRRAAATADDLAEACLAAFDLTRDARTVDTCRAVAAGYDWDAAVAPRLLELYAPPEERR
jgi:glycosyltransferase involved in cell wall biosynthesis